MINLGSRQSNTSVKRWTRKKRYPNKMFVLVPVSWNILLQLGTLGDKFEYGNGSCRDEEICG